ncbi:M20 family metallopeptidase [Thalassobacillus hwangdonensis]|uniref:M20 family metallopeptidase n=1 Tax=Thalassobacillus hwangdonensis TaxID=546108 RepID=A0ABW3L1I7_9BACI
MNRLLNYMNKHQDEMVDDLQRLVESESPSEVKDLVDQCGQLLRGMMEEYIGGEVEVYPQVERGDHFKLTVGEGEKRVLLLSHFDTVWDKGRLPMKMTDGKFYGPGVLDMKGGIIQAVWALKALKELGDLPDHQIVFLCTSDEELGSQTSRALLEKEAAASDAVLVTEPPVAKTGALKTGRKGVGIYDLIVHGKASHAGNDHESGRSAIKELAHQVIRLEEMTDYEVGTTVNVGVVQGGTRMNVVSEYAEAKIDFRVKTAKEAERMVQVMEEIKPITEGVQVEVRGELNRPPMERTDEIGALFTKAKEAAAEMGFEVDEAQVGGGSDGNFTAMIGTPTIDGLGALGEGPHAEHEHIVLDELPKRAAMLAGLLQKI